MNLDLLRSFFVIAEQGSLNKAAERLHVSQSTLTRQMQTLEQEIGGPLLERGPGGVALTATGHALADGMRPLLVEFDRTLGEVRKRARGQSAELRIGYLMSAVAEYLNPALAALRRAHAEVKVKLLDLSPGEQVTALRRGELDLALIGSAGAFVSREFYVRRVALLTVHVAIADTHRLVEQASVCLGDLREEVFVGAPDEDVPGHNRWVSQLCRKAGFRARFVQNAESLTHGLLLVVTDGAVALVPEYAKSIRVPGVVLRPLKDAGAKLDLSVAWPRGKVSAPLRVLLEALTQGAVGK